MITATSAVTAITVITATPSHTFLSQMVWRNTGVHPVFTSQAGSFEIGICLQSSWSLPGLHFGRGLQRGVLSKQILEIQVDLFGLRL